MEEKNAKKTLIFSTVALVASVVILISVIYGWFVAFSSAEIKSFSVDVISSNTDVQINLGGEISQTGGGGLLLEKAYPGREYPFFITVTNTSPTNTANYSLYFMGFSDNLAANGVNLDMFGIFATRIQGENLVYFREGFVVDKVIVDSGTLAASEVKTVTFSLIFAQMYMYSDEELTALYTPQEILANPNLRYTNDETVINQFQDKEFIISNLVVDVS